MADKVIKLEDLNEVKGYIDDKVESKVNTDDPRLSDARTPLFHTHTVSEVTNAESKGKLTINGTEYTLRVSTTDAGAAGYITFVVE